MHVDVDIDAVFQPDRITVGPSVHCRRVVPIVPQSSTIRFLRLALSQYNDTV